MMKQLLLASALLFGLTAAAQTEEELQKLIERAEKMADKARKDPRYRPGMEEGSASTGFPKKNKAILAEIPARPLSNVQMGQYVSNLYIAYKTKFPAAAIASAKKISQQLQNNPGKIGEASAAAWYNKDIHTAVLLALDAGSKKPDEPLLLNNLGAMLHAGGASRHALPILVSLGHLYPGNAMVLNNIGQAYAGVGELDSAMKYLVRCIRKSPKHPEANNTAGQIEKQKGNTTEAKKYFQQSPQGAHNAAALEGLQEIAGNDLGQALPPLGRPGEMPYFNEFKYQLPRPCINPADGPIIKQEHADFVKFIEDAMAAYANAASYEDKIGNELLTKDAKELQDKTYQALNSGQLLTAQPFLGSPLNQVGLRKLADLTLRLQVKDMPMHEEEMSKLKDVYENLIIQFEKQKKLIQADYKEKRSKYDCGEGRAADCAAIAKLSKEECEKIAALANTAQVRISGAKTDIQLARLRYLRWEFNTFAYYGYMAGFNEHLANATFYRQAGMYLNGLRELASGPYICDVRRCDGKVIETNSKKESDELKKMNCPIDINIKFIVGKISLNCDKFTFEAGEGVIFTAEKDFNTRQTTMTLGAGLQFQAGKEWGIFKGDLSGSAQQAFYITWDGNDQITDAGLTIKSEGSFEAEAKVETPFNIGDDYLKQKYEAKGEFGYTLGINSGWNFNDGTLNSVVNSIGGIFKK